MFVSTNTRWFCSFFHEWIREKPVRKIWWQSQGIPALKFCRHNGNHREKTAILAWKQNFYDVRIHSKVVTFSRGRYNWRAFIFHIKRVFWCFVRIQSDRNQKVKHDILHDLTDQKIQLLRESYYLPRDWHFFLFKLKAKVTKSLDIPFINCYFYAIISQTLLPKRKMFWYNGNNCM